MKTLFFLLVLIFIFSSCIKPTDVMIEEAIAGTELARVYTEESKVTLTPIVTLTPTFTPTPIGRSSGKIIYQMSSFEDADLSNIMIIDVVTRETTNITNNVNKNMSFYFPSSSLDGKKIAYCLMKRMVDDFGKEYWTSEIYSMDIEGKNQQKISTIPMFKGNVQIQNFIQEMHPAWSPDDRRIAFESNRDILLNNKNFDMEIFVIDLETNEIKQLTKASGTSEHPSWSPDGSRIAFMSNRDGDWDIFTMNSYGTGDDIKLTNNNTSERFPSWSHDGKNIVYHSDRDGNNNLYLYNFETKQEAQLTNNPAGEWTGRWSPDDNWIVFGSDRDGDWEIFIINVLTKEEVKITDNQAEDGLQNWIP